jgi:hypothetical protein
MKNAESGMLKSVPGSSFLVFERRASTDALKVLSLFANEEPRTY